MSAATIAVALAAVLTWAAPAQVREVAQLSDFFESQAKLRAQAEQQKRQQARDDQEERRKPSADAKKKPPEPKSQEARRRAKKPKPKEEEKKADAGPATPSAPPTYIRAKREPIVKALGAEVAGKIFSHEFTPVRQLAISRSARVIPRFECPNDPAVALTDVVPFPVKPGVASWIEGYVVGCKPRTKRNFLVMLDDGKPQIAELLPGLSIADPLLQRDAVPGAQASAKEARPEGCEKSVIADTRLAEPLTGKGRPWVELWTLDQCGNERRIEMRFTPSKEGGTRWAAKLIK